MTLIPLTVLVPMVCACGLAGLSPFVKRREGAFAVATMIATVVLAALVLGREASPTTVWFGGWTPRNGVAVGVGFAVDGIGGGMAVFVAALGLVGAVVASRVIAAEEMAFDAVTLIFVAAMIGFCLTGDLFNMFVFFELMSVAAYVLVGYEIRVRSAIEGALTFAVTNTVGSILLLFGIALLYGRTGALNLAQMGLTLESGPHDTLVVVAFAMVAAGLLVKAAVIPFHLWTADAYAVAPTPICILLAGAFSELGLYGLARVYWTVFAPTLEPHSDALRLILVVAGLATGLLGAVMCAAQHHLKRMLAFATIAQVGLFLVGIGLLSADGIAGAGVWVVGDGLVKAGLFTCVAVVQHRYDTVEVGRLHGRARSLWPIGALFVLGALIIASLPPTGSFLGKAVIEDAALIEPGYDWVPAVMLIVTGLLGGTLLRAAARVFWGIGDSPPQDPAGEVADDEEPDREAGDPSGTSPLLWAPAFVLIAAAVVWGVLPGLLDAAGRAAASFVDEPGYAKAVLEGHVTHHAVPPTLHSPGGTSYLYAAGSLVLALAVAALSLGVGGTLPRPVAATVNGLRRIHNGRTGDYVAWTVAGTVVFGGLFALVLQ